MAFLDILQSLKQMVISAGLKFLRHPVKPDHGSLFENANLIQCGQLAGDAGKSAVQLSKQVVNEGLSGRVKIGCSHSLPPIQVNFG